MQHWACPEGYPRAALGLGTLRNRLSFSCSDYLSIEDLLTTIYFQRTIFSLLQALIQPLLNQGYSQLTDLPHRLSTCHLHQHTSPRQFPIFTASTQGSCASPPLLCPTKLPTSWSASDMSCRKPKSRIWKAAISHLIVLCALFKCPADKTYQKLLMPGCPQEMKEATQHQHNTIAVWMLMQRHPVHHAICGRSTILKWLKRGRPETGAAPGTREEK